MNEDYSKYNEIDMECNCCDDDDSFVIKSNDYNDRNINTHTGIIVNFSDDDEDIPVKIIKADTKNNKLNIVNTANDFNMPYNEIDMECNCSEDDCYEENYKRPKLDFGDDELDFNNKELVDEDILEEKKSHKSKITPGEVEDDYWKKLSKAHAKTNVKGAYNTHFHLCGDPTKEMEMFNHDMRSDTTSTEGAASSLTNISNASTVATSGDAGGEGSVSCGESLENSKYKKLFENLLLITGFIVEPKDNKYIVKDKLNTLDDACCNNKEELKNYLYPYVQDYFIYPLQVKTGQNFDDCNDWCNWYNEENQLTYPTCQNDIEYCDLIANHWNEI